MRTLELLDPKLRVETIDSHHAFACFVPMNFSALGVHGAIRWLKNVASLC